MALVETKIKFQQKLRKRTNELKFKVMITEAVMDTIPRGGNRKSMDQTSQVKINIQKHEAVQK